MATPEVHSMTIDEPEGRTRTRAAGPVAVVTGTTPVRTVSSAGAAAGAVAADGAAAAPAGAPAPDEVEVPTDHAGIEVLRREIDEIDAEIVRLIQRRTAVSHAIGAARKSFGGPRIVYSREMAVLQRFRELGPAGTDLGMMLLAMGRGRMGRR